jgi:hypothetical protein
MIRVASLLVAVALATGVGLAVTPTASYAACKSASCNGEPPGTHGCHPGTSRLAYFFISGAMSIHLRRNVNECGGLAHWARLVWDGTANPNQVQRWNFRVQHQKWVTQPNPGWLTANTQSTTTDGSRGAWNTRMVAGASGAPARYRVCYRTSSRLIEGWTPWSSWWCSEWVYSNV